MDIVAAVFVDFEESFLGIGSQVLTPIGSRSILGHTLSRVALIGGVAQRCLMVRPRDEAVARAVLEELRLTEAFELLPLDQGSRPRRRLLRCGRKWNLSGWRGSPLGTTWFDEYVELHAVATVLDHYKYEAVLCLDGHQPVLDVGIATTMIAYQREYEAEARFVFTTAPPGLAGIILRREVTREYLEQNYPVGLLMSYRPELAQTDPITKDPCFRISSEISQTPGRYTGDTRASREMLAAALAELGEDCDAQSLCAWTRAWQHDRIERLPHEVELEITTQTPLPETSLHPRGKRVPRRQVEDLDAISRLVEQLAEYDDRMLLLGGHGDPLLHPHFPEICRRVKAASVCGLGVVTTLVELPEETLQSLLEHRVDLLEVQLDANCAATYRAVHNSDAFARVIENVERIQNARRAHQNPHPLVACSLTRCAATLAELEPFFEQWIKLTGWAVIRGYNDYTGTLPADPLLGMKPPLRRPCQRLSRRMMLLADGRAVYCSQDYAGTTAFGSWFSQDLDELWNAASLAALRQAHRCGEPDKYPLCSKCGEWFRP